MKKIVLSLGLIVLLIAGMFSLSGCIRDSDESIAKKNLEKLVNAMESEDRDAVKALFASNKIAGIEDFDQSIDELLAYYEGDYVSHLGGGPGTSNEKDGSSVYKYHLMSNDITTTAGVYRIALKWYITDTVDTGNVGIWSLYILNMEDETERDLYYWGDATWSFGIHVGTPRPSFSDDAE